VSTAGGSPVAVARRKAVSMLTRRYYASSDVPTVALRGVRPRVRQPQSVACVRPALHARASLSRQAARDPRNLSRSGQGDPGDRARAGAAREDANRVPGADVVRAGHTPARLARRTCRPRASARPPAVQAGADVFAPQSP